MASSVIIIGASHAAVQTCVSLRQGGWEGAITVIGEEAELPYHRPPLSKDFLSGQKTIEDILIRPAEVYAKANIDMRLGDRVTEIRPYTRQIITNAGEIFSYSKLVLTTGARIRRLPVPGEDLENVFYLRDTRDVLAIKNKAKSAQTALIIGGGYIGLETAASLRKQGLEVTILEAMPRILQRVTAPELSAFYKRIHEEEGVSILENVTASKIANSDTGLSVETKDGQALTADMVIIGIGVIPNIELAEAAGLTVGNGIDVNEFCQTSDADIYAAGDVTWHHNPIYNRYIRLESVPNATEQGRPSPRILMGYRNPIIVCRGFGQINLTSNSKSQGFLRAMIKLSFASI